MGHDRIIDLEVDIASLRRRFDALEARIYGRVDDLPGPQPLFDLYAHLQLDGITPSPDSAAMLRSCILLMSPRLLLDLGRLTGDMFAWRPFLGAADLLQALGHDMLEAIEWLEGCAAELLRAQGLRMLRVEDVLRSPVGPTHTLREFALSDGRRST